MEHILEKEYGKDLPQSYLDYLRSSEVLEVIVDEHAYNDKYENRYWVCKPQKELLEVMEMTDVGKAKNYECLKLYIKVFMEFSYSEFIESNVGDIPKSRIENSFVFAEENGDYLYLDSEDGYSIWIYYHEGGDVKRVSNSFEELLKFQ
ncbi:MAG: SMI1/KNR4 family protein [Bacteroidia bacterium]|nr:SMI1/KNR4 family protein [Bacteroidia bacterium]